MSPHAFLAAVLLAAFLSPSAAAQAQLQPPLPVPSPATTTGCQPQWIPTFGGAPGANYQVMALAEYDSGSGPELYAGGQFSIIGGVSAKAFARRDAQHWSEVGGGLAGMAYPEVHSLCVFDDGSGPALFVGGRFGTAGGVQAAYISKWNGSTWSGLANGVDNYVRALAVFDDGSGPALFAGGSFVSASGTVVNRIAKWTGTSWVPLGTGMNGEVHALCDFDDGAGHALYAGGIFTTAGGQTTGGIAKWNGSSWSAVGGSGSFATLSMTVYDDGGGPALFAGGNFPGIAGNIAKWNGASWSALGVGLSGGGAIALHVFDDGSGPALIAAGNFSSAGGSPAANIARWDGNAWSTLATGLPSTTYSLATFDAGSGPELFAGGAAQLGGGIGYGGIAHWNGQQWAALHSGGLNGNVVALHAFDDGTGEALYAGGGFTTANGLPAQHVAQWRGGWSALGDGLDGYVFALGSFDDGGGERLYAGGSISASGTTGLGNIAVWDGTSWASPATGTDGRVHALKVYDEGSGPALFAGGAFNLAGGVMAHGIAKWQHGLWSTVGGGVSGNTGSATVYALEVYDDGSGPALYVAGTFTQAGGLPAARIARWDGNAWTALGTGADYDVYALAVWDDGAGPGLYVGGHFALAGGVLSPGIARWRGNSWSALGYGLPWGYVSSLSGFVQSSGSALFIGGWFEQDSMIAGNFIMQWDGTNWAAVGSGMSSNGYVAALTTIDDGSGPILCAGGNFASCLDSGDSFVARWGVPVGCGMPATIFCEPGFGSPSTCPCSNPPTGVWRGCNNSSATGGARLAAGGKAWLSNDVLVFNASDEPPTALSVLLQADAQSSPGVPFAQGVRCLAGIQRRLYARAAVQGTLALPGAGDPSVSARSAALGDPLLAGMHRYYGVFYRDPTVLGGCPATSTFNITQQLDVLWQP